MTQPVSAGIRISVRSEDGAADPSATAVLQRRLGEHAPGRERWREARSVPRPDSPDTQGAFSDIVLVFVTDQLVPELIKEAVKSAAVYLVWAVVSHLRSQPDPSQKVVLSRSDGDHEVTVELSATGLSREETDEAQRRLEELIERAITRLRREAASEDED